MAQWYLKINGEESGPLETSEINSLAASGKLSSGDLVRRGDRSDWVRADQVKGLLVSTKAPSLKKKRLAIGIGGVVGLWLICACISNYAPSVRSPLKSENDAPSPQRPLESQNDTPSLQRPLQSQNAMPHIYAMSQEQVSEMFGPPDYVFPNGGIFGGWEFDESWGYERMWKHPISGQWQSINIFFNNGHAVAYDVE